MEEELRREDREVREGTDGVGDACVQADPAGSSRDANDTAQTHETGTGPSVRKRQRPRRKFGRRMSGAQRRSAAGTFVHDPVKQYLREIGQVDLHTASEEVDLAMRMEAGVTATERLEVAEQGEIEPHASSSLSSRSW